MSPTLGTASEALLVAAIVVYAAAAVLRATRTADSGHGLVAVGATVHLASVVVRGVAGGHAPWANMYEFSSVVALVAVVVALVAARRTGLAGVLTGTLVVVLASLVAALALVTPAAPVPPALDSMWLSIHTSAAVLASGVLTVGAATTALYLWRDARAAPTGEPTPPIPATVVLVAAAPSSTVASAPSATSTRAGGPTTPARSSLEMLDTVSRITVSGGFLVWTFAVVTGAIWAEQAWGRYWGWDPKETAAFVTWVMYAAYLHARATPRWRGRRAAWLGLGAYAALLVTYYVVNLVVVGLHSYA